MPRARRLLLLILIIPLLTILTLLTLRTAPLPPDIESELSPAVRGEPAGYDPKAKPIPLHKPPLPEKPPPITDNFPLASHAKSPSDLPPIPAWNVPPRTHYKHATPLFIGFTRNWRLLQQTVVSYIVAGWPPSDIYVVENTGVMHSNADAKLTLQNPFFLDHGRLKRVLGVNVVVTPTLLTFAQLQNFYVWTALERGWVWYWWAHMDTVVVSDEEWDPASDKKEDDKKDESGVSKDDAKKAEPPKQKDEGGYKSLYLRAIAALEETLDLDWGDLATRWFAYDRLALVKTKTFVDVGGWDTMIPFYMTDCDMHERLWMRGYRIEDAQAGRVWDVAGTLEDLGVLYLRGEVPAPKEEEDAKKKDDEKKKEEKEKRDLLPDLNDYLSNRSSKPAKPSRNSPAYKALIQKLDDLQHKKNDNAAGRNTWQASQKGGQGEPFYRDSDGFERGVWMWMDFGRKVFEEKWGRGPCDIRDAGLKEEDQWHVVLDWEKEEVQRQYWRDKEREGKEKEKAEKEKGKKEKEEEKKKEEG
ncbi:MAG: hypothetical protein OHK93_003101 [Ramalina farinacea]|uniref:Uncharacterized protein n=1 Tax=Ramalina farinacea TaxID=258253 RepID=A0AA43QSS1_9LECA|nr:hypothetical protein [Ramalina farinacea]